MAKINIREMEKLDKNRNAVHEDVKATYTVFIKDGEKYFQIDTYGKSDRKFVSKVSQAVQLDRAGAIGLINLLKNEFNL
ncbi:MAG: methionyl-tRNA formyltransferase [Christensenellaceae bacterium]